MALKDWVRHDGNIESTPGPVPIYRNDEEFIMLVRDIQFQDVKYGAYTRFPTLYDVALANKGRNYIPVTDNTRLTQDFIPTNNTATIQDPPYPSMINSYRKNQSL